MIQHISERGYTSVQIWLYFSEIYNKEWNIPGATRTSDSAKLNADWNTRHTLQNFVLLSVCLCPEPFRWWLLLLYSLLSKEDSTPFATLLASMHPWGPSNRFSSGGGSGGGGRSKHKEVEGIECMKNVWTLDHKEENFLLFLFHNNLRVLQKGNESILFLLSGFAAHNWERDASYGVAFFKKTGVNLNK